MIPISTLPNGPDGPPSLAPAVARGAANARSGLPSQRSPCTPLNAAIPNSRRVQFIGGRSLPAAAIGDERLDFVERGHRDRAAVAPGHNRAARVSQARRSLERPVVEVPVKETA